MKTLLFALSFLFLAQAQASLTFEVKELPVEYFLFRPHSVSNVPISPKPSPEQIAAAKRLQEQVRMTLTEMEGEAKKLSLKASDKLVTIFDWEKKTSILALPVTGSVATVPQGKLMIRPAGKYMVATFVGKPALIQTVLMQCKDYVTKNKLTTLDNFYYQYSKFGTFNEPITFLARVK